MPCLKPDTAFVHHPLSQCDVFEPIRVPATKAVESMESQGDCSARIGIANHELPLCLAGRVSYFREAFKIVHELSLRCPLTDGTNYNPTRHITTPIRRSESSMLEFVRSKSWNHLIRFRNTSTRFSSMNRNFLHGERVVNGLGIQLPVS